LSFENSKPNDMPARISFSAPGLKWIDDVCGGRPLASAVAASAATHASAEAKRVMCLTYRDVASCYDPLVRTLIAMGFRR
jgi:hypothetical protein